MNVSITFGKNKKIKMEFKDREFKNMVKRKLLKSWRDFKNMEEKNLNIYTQNIFY